MEPCFGVPGEDEWAEGAEGATTTLQCLSDGHLSGKDAISFNAAIRACSLAECWQNAMALLQAKGSPGTWYSSNMVASCLATSFMMGDQSLPPAGYAPGDAEDRNCRLVFF